MVSEVASSSSHPGGFWGEGKGKGKGPFIQRKPRFSFLPLTYSSFPHSGARIAPPLLSSSSSADHFVKCIGQPPRPPAPEPVFDLVICTTLPSCVGKHERSRITIYTILQVTAGGARKGAQNELKMRSQTLFLRVKIRNVHLQWIFTTTVRYATVPYFLPPRFFLRVSTPPFFSPVGLSGKFADINLPPPAGAPKILPRGETRSSFVQGPAGYRLQDS